VGKENGPPKVEDAPKGVYLHGDVGMYENHHMGVVLTFVRVREIIFDGFVL
jgi:predicted ATPase